MFHKTHSYNPPRTVLGRARDSSWISFKVETQAAGINSFLIELVGDKICDVRRGHDEIGYGHDHDEIDYGHDHDIRGRQVAEKLSRWQEGKRNVGFRVRVLCPYLVRLEYKITTCKSIFIE